MFDKDGDGLITLKELMTLMKSASRRFVHFDQLLKVTAKWKLYKNITKEKTRHDSAVKITALSENHL